MSPPPNAHAQLLHYCEDQSQTLTLTAFPQFVIAGCSPSFFLPPVCISFLLCDNPIGAQCSSLQLEAETLFHLAVNGDPSPLPPVSAPAQQVRLQTSGGGGDCHRRMTASRPARFFEADASRSAPRLVRHAWSLP